jgi:hypothetical protein
VRLGVRESFQGTIRGTDLIVGARGGTTQVLLSTVFGMATPSGTISWGTYERWAAHPAVKWTIPFALGDAHKGHRVIGTTAAFFEQYRFRDQRVTFASGHAPATAHEIAVGSEVAERLGYAVGDSVVLAHGVAAVSFAEHTAHPFIVSGVIARTFTPIDRALYTTLDGLTEMHETEEAAGGLMMGPPPAPVAPGAKPPITAFLVGTKNRVETIQLQFEMNQDRTEPLTAIIPGVALAQLWQTIGSAEVGAARGGAVHGAGGAHRDVRRVVCLAGIATARDGDPARGGRRSTGDRLPAGLRVGPPRDDGRGDRGPTRVQRDRSGTLGGRGAVRARPHATRARRRRVELPRPRRGRGDACRGSPGMARVPVLIG